MFFSIFRIIDADEGYILTGAMRISAGQLMYKDFFAHTPPVSYYAVALAFKAFGQQVIVGRLLTVVLGLFISIFLYLISLKVLPRKYAVIPAIIFAFWGTGHVNYPSFAWFGLLFSLIALYFFTMFLKSDKSKYIFLTGLFTGLSFLSKQNSGFCSLSIFALFIILNVLISFRIRIKAGLSQAAKNISVLIGACALPIIIVSYLFYLNGGLSKFLYCVFAAAARSGIERRELFPFPDINFPTVILGAIYALLTYLGLRRLKAGRTARPFIVCAALYLIFLLVVIVFERTLSQFNILLDYIKTGVMRGFYIYLALSCVIAIIIIFLKIIRRPHIYPAKKSLLAVSIFAILYTWAGLFISTDMHHHIMSYPPTFIVGVYILYQAKAYILLRLRRAKSYDANRPYCIRCAALFAFVMPLLFILALGFVTNLNNGAYEGEAPIYTMRYPVGLDRAKYIYVNKEDSDRIAKTVNFLVNKTDAGEKIFLPDFGSGNIFFLSNRLPASYFHFVHIDTVHPSDQQQIIDELRNNKVRYIFLEEKQFEDIYRDNLYKRPYILEVEKYMHDNYALIFKCGRYIIIGKNNCNPSNT